MNLAAVYNQASAEAGSPDRWETLTPLQRELVEVMARGVETGMTDPAAVASYGVSRLV